MDCPDKLRKINLIFLVRGVRRGVSGASRGNSAIFELQTPYFAWKFVWTVTTNYENFFGQGRQKGGSQGRQEVTQPFFEL